MKPFVFALCIAAILQPTAWGSASAQTDTGWVLGSFALPAAMPAWIYLRFPYADYGPGYIGYRIPTLPCYDTWYTCGVKCHVTAVWELCAGATF